MSFNVLAVQSGLDPGDGALYPKVSDGTGPEIITLENQDGPNVMRAVATAVRVLEVGETGLKTLVRLREVKIDVYVTDSRLALACEKYDKGGGWVGFGPGGLLVAVTANAVSKARAASRSRGKVLVGHLRYPWLRSVGASSKSGVVSSEAIRLEYSEKSSGKVVRKIVELTLPKNIDATLVAQEITRRAAAYRLANYFDMKAEERAKFVSMSEQPPRLQPPPKKFAFVQMPTFYYANAATAFPGPRQSAEPPGPAAGESAGFEDFGEHDGTGAGSAEPFPPDVPPAQPQQPAPSAQRQPANFCTKCGNRLVLGDRFCPACGGPVGGAEGIPRSAVSGN
jgi:zinc ribbon protein